MTEPRRLPVDSLLPDLARAVADHPIVILEAPPGSGKTTRVAPHLVDSLAGNENPRIFLLQPRRVAARATAQRIAEERMWEMGRQVGYQVRFENRAKESTPLVVATEGILLRRISEDAALSGIGLVVLDEFHERSLNADLLLGMLRRIQEVLRDDLRVLIMSATIDTQALANHLHAPVLSTSGTLHPVQIRYRPPRARANLIDHITDTIVNTWERQDGDILVFLPGVGEIQRVQRQLEQQGTAANCEILPLHGSLPLEAQNRVLFASPARRVVLATNVAETSLTIEGIRHVIDSGQVRVLRFQPNIGLDRLELESVCQNSADQRAGRAGRLSDGHCIRLWDEKSQRARPQQLEPEIRRVDLSGVVLQLLQWGESVDGDFPWLEPPRPESLERASQLLLDLGAVADGGLTGIGSRMARLPIAPRLARMLIEAESFDAIPTIAVVAAMLSERDPFERRRDGSGRRPPTKQTQRWACDVTQRFAALCDFYQDRRNESVFGPIHRNAAHAIQRVARQLADLFHGDLDDLEMGHRTGEIIQRCLLAGFPDRLARRRKPHETKGKMVGGRGVRLAPTSGVMEPEYFLCIEVDAGRTEANVRQASAVDLSWLPSGAIVTREEQFFNPTRQQVEARKRSYYRDLMLVESPTAITDEAMCRDLLLQEAAKRVEAILPPPSSPFSTYLTRLRCLQAWVPELELPDCDESMLLEVAADLCAGRRSLRELQEAPWLDWLKAKLTPEQLQAVDRECPERLRLPNGTQKRLEYELGKPPVLAVRIQEIFSWTETPRVAMGRQKVLLHLLAPNMRPQQVTDDLASFWATTYEVVRKELRRRYPKHAWPEDPLSAEPTR